MCIRDSDYITKPFNILEVKARIKAIMRRTAVRETPKTQENMLESGDMRMDLSLIHIFIVHAGSRIDKQRRGDAQQIQVLDQKALEKILYRLNADLGVMQVQGGSVSVRDE